MDGCIRSSKIIIPAAGIVYRGISPGQMGCGDLAVWSGISVYKVSQGGGEVKGGLLKIPPHHHPLTWGSCITIIYVIQTSDII
jgi:hypothetical protein